MCVRVIVLYFGLDLLPWLLSLVMHASIDCIPSISDSINLRRILFAFYAKNVPMLACCWCLVLAPMVALSIRTVQCHL